MTRYIILILLLSGLTMAKLQGQDVRSAGLTWTVTTIKDLDTGDSKAFGCTFESNGIGNILWKQNAGGYVRTLVTQTVTGSFPNVTAIGQLTYNISEDGDTGTVIFERNSSGVFITLDISDGTGPRISNKYTVFSVGG